jgi:hypothetical protein
MSVFKQNVAYQENSQSSFRFLDLPTELRITIYKLYFYKPHAICLDRCSRIHPVGRSAGLSLEVNFLLVNKTVYAEASAQLYQVNKFWLSYSFDRIWDSVGPITRANVKQLEVDKPSPFSSLKSVRRRWTPYAWNMNLHAFTKLEYLDLYTVFYPIFTDFITWLTAKVTLLSSSTIIVLEVQVQLHNDGLRFGLSSTDNDDIQSGTGFATTEVNFCPHSDSHSDKLTTPETSRATRGTVVAWN